MLPVMTLKKDELIKRFTALVAQHGQEWQEIADILNHEGMATLKGRQWVRNNAKQFYNQHCLSPVKRGSSAKSVGARGLPEWMDVDAMEDLRDMLGWWREKKHAPLREVQSRPVFRGKRRNTGVHVNEEILNRTMKKLKTDKVRTGGSLSLLVELLLWKYIGGPPDLLEKVPSGSHEPDAWSVLHSTPESAYGD